MNQCAHHWSCTQSDRRHKPVPFTGRLAHTEEATGQHRWPSCVLRVVRAQDRTCARIAHGPRVARAQRCASWWKGTPISMHLGCVNVQNSMRLNAHRGMCIPWCARTRDARALVRAHPNVCTQGLVHAQGHVWFGMCDHEGPGAHTPRTLKRISKWTHVAMLCWKFRRIYYNSPLTCNMEFDTSITERLREAIWERLRPKAIRTFPY